MKIDVSLTEDDGNPGHLIAHHPDCPVVQQHRDQDRMICTMIEVTPPLPGVRLHSCLTREGKPR